MKKIYFTFLFLLCFGLGFAQDKGHNPYNDKKSAYGNASKIDPIPTALDGGVGFLLAAGVGYGLKRMRKK